MLTATTLKGCSILVVEDDPDALELYTASLAKLGADTRRANRVDVAILLLRQWRPDVVLCDLHLPVLDGYSLLEGMREDSSLRDIPVIAISGSDPNIERERALHAGFAQHLTKPTKLREIVAAIDAVLRAVQPAHSSSAEQALACVRSEPTVA